MAAIQEPEVQFAQRLASNEKPTRTKAIKKLRKYINVRSQKTIGGFTADEMLKLWKGLFYCLWMQDRPLLQEELSRQISTLIHSFHDVDGQFLYLESFLQTFKREWTGIDRLRMDKFFQLVRFMFRQTFEMLKRKNWESSVVTRFLELLTSQLLQSSSGAPSGLQFHILDLYMTELAAVGSAELTADQNLIFIEPFCKTAGKTKDRTLFGAICSSIFSTIIDQAPFAIEDLMKELQAIKDSDSDSGQVSERDDDEEEEVKDRSRRKAGSSKGTGKQINGTSAHQTGHKLNDEDGDGSDEDGELSHMEDSDTEMPCDDEIGPVLQFDYKALANKLFEVASRNNTPSQNRKRLYKIIKVLRDLTEGVFPQDEYPEEVSTDEDDDMFGSRKRIKGKGGHEEEEMGAPASKKRKGNKKVASALNKQNNNIGQDDSEAAELTVNNESKTKKKKKKKKKKARHEGSEENADKPEQEQITTEIQSIIEEPEGGQESSRADLERGKDTQSFTSSVRVTEGCNHKSEPLLLSEGDKQPSDTVSEETTTTDCKDQTQQLSTNKRKKGISEQKPEVTAASGEQQTAAGTEISSDADAPVSGKKRRKKGLKSQTGGTVAESQVQPEAQITLESVDDSTAPTMSKKKKLKAEAQKVEEKFADSKSTSVGEEVSQDATTVPSKKKKKDLTLKASPAENESIVTPLKKKRKKNQKEPKTEKEGMLVEKEQDTEKMLLDTILTTPAKKKKKTRVDETKDHSQVVGSVDSEPPVDETALLPGAGKTAKKKKKRKIPVVFEFEADELEAKAQEAASISGLGEEEKEDKKTKGGSDVGVPITTVSSKKLQKTAKTSTGLASDFITFQSNGVVPKPLFCKAKQIPSTPLSSKKKSQTPKSESKKVTFGLKNNKTAEFRKTDRSLLVSPDGSSRVPFDPKQKPKFGVLKSPATPLSTTKKTPNGNRKPGLKTPKNTTKQRPTAADFF